uniref:Uncharacterized protein n=1 Tax=Cucumis melo TaxID=3656 RepID=A0A9I9EJZ2_CUCME
MLGNTASAGGKKSGKVASSYGNDGASQRVYYKKLIEQLLQGLLMSLVLRVGNLMLKLKLITTKFKSGYGKEEILLALRQLDIEFKESADEQKR